MNSNYGETGLKRILIYPAAFDSGEGIEEKIWFLFSLRQVEDILKDAFVFPMPFSLPHIEGITLWRSNIAPVMTLEKCIGPAFSEKAQPERFLMVRDGSVNPEGKESRTLIAATEGIRILTLPIEAEPVRGFDWVRNPSLVRGIYRWEEGYFIIMHLGRLLRGEV